MVQGILQVSHEQRRVLTPVTLATRAANRGHSQLERGRVIREWYVPIHRWRWTYHYSLVERLNSTSWNSLS